jgi:hypothetical protein
MEGAIFRTTELVSPRTCAAGHLHRGTGILPVVARASSPCSYHRHPPSPIRYSLFDIPPSSFVRRHSTFSRPYQQNRSIPLMSSCPLPVTTSELSGEKNRPLGIRATRGVIWTSGAPNDFSRSCDSPSTPVYYSEEPQSSPRFPLQARSVSFTMVVVLRGPRRIGGPVVSSLSSAFAHWVPKVLMLLLKGAGK